MKRLAISVALGAMAAVALLAWANAPTPSLPPGTKADRILVVKSEHRLSLLKNGTRIATYPVALGRGSKGPKQREGDGRTPEGLYRIDFHHRGSAFYRALHVSYPAPKDIARARALGAQPGGSIMLHGLPPKFALVGRLQRWADWTNGCIALTNPEMQQVFDAVPDGTPIEIRP